MSEHKKLICIILALALVFTAAGFTASFAEEGLAAVRSDASNEIHTFINPLYRDILTEEDLWPNGIPNRPRLLNSPGNDVPVFDDIESAGAYMAQQMAARSTDISVIVRGTTANSMQEVFSSAFAHDPADPTGGDYLRWQYGGYSFYNPVQVDDGYKFRFINIVYYTSVAQESEVAEAADSLLASLDLEGKSDAVKLRLIYDYIIDNITYAPDPSVIMTHTAYAALIDKSAVCQGYALLLYRLLLSVGIDTRIIAGDAGGGHAWNIVKLGNYYYDVDATWDAGWNDYEYYLRTDDYFDDTHTRSGIVDDGDIDYTSPEFYAQYPMDSADYGYSFADGVLTILGDLGRVYDDFFAYRLSDRSSEVTSVVLEPGIESIGNRSFSGLPALETISIPNGVKSVGDDAFRECASLSELILPASVTSIGGSAVYSCPAIEYVEINGPVTEIPPYAFTWCGSLTTVCLPASVTVISKAAFNACGALADVYFGGSEEEWALVEIEEANYKLLPGYQNTATVHYNYDPHPPVASGTLGGSFGWALDDQDVISFTGTDLLPEGHMIMVAEYGDDGSFLGVQYVLSGQDSAELKNDPDTVKLFWINAFFAPQSACAVIGD